MEVQLLNTDNAWWHIWCLYSHISPNEELHQVLVVGCSSLASKWRIHRKSRPSFSHTLLAKGSLALQYEHSSISLPGNVLAIWVVAVHFLLVGLQAQQAVEHLP